MGSCCGACACQGGNCKPILYPGVGVGEITQTIQALQQVGIIKETMTTFNNPYLACSKTRRPLENDCRLYRELNKVTPPLAVTVPDTVTSIEKISKNLQCWMVVIDLANDLFSIATALGHQNQSFTWQQKQYTFQVLPQGYK